MSNIPPLYTGSHKTKSSPWFALPIAATAILVALIVVAVTRSSHPHPALAAARHHATSHAVAKSKTTKTTTTAPKPSSTTPAPTSPPVAPGATTPIGYVSKPFATPSAALQSVGVPPSYPDIEIVPVPGGGGKWAIEPEAISVQGHDELSMAWTIADGQWEAWTTTFPGGAPSGVPFALYDAANIGYNLHEGIQMPGPASGTVPWTASPARSPDLRGGS